MYTGQVFGYNLGFWSNGLNCWNFLIVHIVIELKLLFLGYPVYWPCELNGPMDTNFVFMCLSHFCDLCDYYMVFLLLSCMVFLLLSFSPFACVYCYQADKFKMKSIKLEMSSKFFFACF